MREAAQVTAAKVLGTPTQFRGLRTDSRSISRGELFVALSGPNFDGHDFVDAAVARGAAAVAVTLEGDYPVPALCVNDTQTALGALASHWRLLRAPTVLAVTGSNGKTTVKEMCASILRQRACVHATRGNLNNHIGVPLTLVELSEKHTFAVVEMGANHAGEIAHLAALAKPDVGVVTHCGPAHLEGFGSLDGVAHAKGELFAGLDSSATAVINADDPYAKLWTTLAGASSIVTFATRTAADVRATGQWQGSHLLLTVTIGGDTLEAKLRLPGEHNVSNAAAASAACFAAGASLEDIRLGLEAMQPVRGRLELRERADGLRLIDDTYNANPASLEVGLKVLATHTGVRHLVLGDMGELGEDEVGHHVRAGELARNLGVNVLWTLGELSAHASSAFGKDASHSSDLQELLVALTSRLNGNDAVLVKGSRAMKMERVVEALMSENAACC